MKQYVVDAFTSQVFRGNPAAICILDKWIEDELMMNITMENNLSETAFAVKTGTEGDRCTKYHLRWFTPGGEIDLCGHATLASAFVIMNYYEPDKKEVIFDTLSGPLRVKRIEEEGGDLYEMDFPAYDLKPVAVTAEMEDAIGARPLEAWMGRDLLCVFDSQETVRNLSPDLEKLKNLDGLLLQATAAGDDTDCVSRTFAPKLNVAEDPVCGSGHCHIIPYWAKRLQQDSLVAYQASRRGGTLYCRLEGERVVMAGKAALYAVSELQVEV